jgi:hypothetical protein
MAEQCAGAIFDEGGVYDQLLLKEMFNNSVLEDAAPDRQSRCVEGLVGKIVAANDV